jgi:hypothetical protein
MSSNLRLGAFTVRRHLRQTFLPNVADSPSISRSSATSDSHEHGGSPLDTFRSNKSARSGAAGLCKIAQIAQIVEAKIIQT